MPKIILTEGQANRERIRVNLKLAKSILGGTNEKLAKVMGVTAATVSNRFKKPGLLNIDEITKICKAAKIDMARFVTETLSIR